MATGTNVRKPIAGAPGKTHSTRMRWHSIAQKYGQALLTDNEICQLFPPPEWMRSTHLRMWCDCIRSYEKGQFKRYNMPMLEQYILVTFNIRKLMRRIGHTNGLTKEFPVQQEDGSIVMVTGINNANKLYTLLTRVQKALHETLHMPPRPYVFNRTDKDDELGVDLEIANASRGGTDRLRLVGGRNREEDAEFASA
jgi:hypothetical protein